GSTPALRPGNPPSRSTVSLGFARSLHAGRIPFRVRCASSCGYRAGTMGFRTLDWRDGALWLLDQRKLPASVEEVRVHSAAETARAIREMVVRGAPAIGCTAAYGVALAARDAVRSSDPERTFAAAVEELRAARPTAV